MNNDQIKEIALHAGFKLKEQPGGGMDLNPYVYTFARHLLATRPAAAEEAGSVDTQVFRQLLWSIQSSSAKAAEATIENVVKCIDAKLAFEHECGYGRALDAHREQSAILRERAEAAHAEGRRSALEELHPQWLKEKERADRAEAERSQQSPVVDVWVDPRTKQRSILDHGTLLAPSDKREFVGSLVWSSDPQDAPVNPENLKLRAAQHLQQEGGKERKNLPPFMTYALCNKLLNNGWSFDGDNPHWSVHEAAKVVGLMKHEHPNLDVPIDAACSAKLDDLGDDSGQGLDGYWKWGFRAGWKYGQEAIAPRPSDNLQQASTAQVEPCTEPNRAACPRKCVDFCNKAEEAASATDAAFKANAGPSPGDMPIDRFINGLPLPQYPAQATPEGADLPEAAIQNGGLVRAALIDLIAAVEPSALSGARDFDQQSHFRTLFARARSAIALTAGGRSAPGWEDALRFGAQVIELYDDATIRESDYMLSSTECAGILEALCSYRAAPPQQVDHGITVGPKFEIKVLWGHYDQDGYWYPNLNLSMSEDEQRQKNEKSGYKCTRRPQQVDTNGLPG